MPPFLDTLLNSDTSPAMSPSLALFALLLTVLIGQSIAWVYQWTHRSLSYSQTFVGSLVVLPVLVALMMVLLVGNMTVAFGFLAVFAMVRFRNVLKDTRDTTFLLWSIVEGLAVGTQRFSTALIGLVALSIVFLYLRVTQFGSRFDYDAILNVCVADGSVVRGSLKGILERHCQRTIMTGDRQAGAAGNTELSYRLVLRDPSRYAELKEELVANPDLSRVMLSLHADDLEA